MFSPKALTQCYLHDCNNWDDKEFYLYEKRRIWQLSSTKSFHQPAPNFSNPALARKSKLLNLPFDCPQHILKKKKLKWLYHEFTRPTFKANASVKETRPFSSSTLTPAHPIHLVSKFCFTPARLVPRYCSEIRHEIYNAHLQHIIYNTVTLPRLQDKVKKHSRKPKVPKYWPKKWSSLICPDCNGFLHLTWSGI